MTNKATFLPVLLASGTLLGTAEAAVVYSDDLSTGAGFTIVGDADSASTFGYDYSAKR